MISKKIIKTLIVTSLSFSSMGLAVNNSITATVGDLSRSIFDGPIDSNPVSAGALGILIIDTNGDGISIFSEGAISDETFMNGTDDYIGGISSTSSVFGVSSMGFSGESVNSPLLEAGDEFYIAWFPTISFSSSNELIVGSEYGLSRGSDWVLGGDGANMSIGSVSGDNTTFSVIASAAAVPEPSTYATICGALVLGLALYRRRNNK